VNRAAFLLARTLRREGPIAALSVPQATLLSDLSGLRVALVGNARSLSASAHGAAIDAADRVIRINRAPMTSVASHGTRIDWLALATALPLAEWRALGQPRILWMSPKRKRLSHALATSPGFYLHPLADYRRLMDRLGAPPTTGAMMIDLLARSGLAGLTLFGFDFFASQSLSGRRTAAQVPHDFAAEARLVADLMARDPRISRAE
jgi:hypothetical protein